MNSEKQREDFWYGIPGAWYGAHKPFAASGTTCYAIIDATKAWEAFTYFAAHKRSVTVVGTGIPVANRAAHGEGGLRIEYEWNKPLATAPVGKGEQMKTFKVVIRTPQAVRFIGTFAARTEQDAIASANKVGELSEYESQHGVYDARYFKES
jgi:hypothetical protein